LETQGGKKPIRKIRGNLAYAKEMNGLLVQSISDIFKIISIGFLGIAEPTG
jgi:hypothetical protein